MESKLSERFKASSLYDVIATVKINGKTETIYPNLTYDEVKEINVAEFDNLHKRYRDIRLRRVPLPDAKVKQQKRDLNKIGRCLECKKEFSGDHCDSLIRRHVAIYRHKVTLIVTSETTYTPETV